ncbi:MAG: nitrile hydratase accessory protein [Paracoccaceae bacterium]
MKVLGKNPVFAEPWHAHVFALAVHLNECGVFTWSVWAERFSQTLSAHGLDRELDGGNDYFTAWLAALESLLAERNLAAPDEVSRRRAEWEAAYLNTPHGDPVRLEDQR